MMTRYEQLTLLQGVAVKMARRTEDDLLGRFYRNAAEGFRLKKEKLSMKEAEEVVD